MLLQSPKDFLSLYACRTLLPHWVPHQNPLTHSSGLWQEVMVWGHTNHLTLTTQRDWFSQALWEGPWEALGAVWSRVRSEGSSRGVGVQAGVLVARGMGLCGRLGSA